MVDVMTFSAIRICFQRNHYWTRYYYLIASELQPHKLVQSGPRFIQSTILKTEQEISIPAPWGKLSALSWGHSAKPPVLLCHGQMDCCSSFRPLVSLLPQEYFYVSVDLPGNGRSDRLPRGVMSVLDLVPSLRRVQDHFKWDKFTFIGHSLGCHIGMYHISAHLGSVTRAVLLDPTIPPHLNKQDLRKWYLKFYSHFYENYEKFNAGVESAPKYRYEEIREKIMSARSLTDEAVEHVLERCLVPAGEGFYRIVFDQRQKITMFPPVTSEVYQRLWTTTNTPILTIVASQSLSDGYDFNPYVLDDTAWPNRDYKHVIIDGDHDIHLNRPDVIVGYIKEFLKETRVD